MIRAIPPSWSHLDVEECHRSQPWVQTKGQEKPRLYYRTGLAALPLALHTHVLRN